MEADGPMKFWLRACAVTALLSVVAISGCAVREPTKETVSDVTWEEAKAATKEMTSEIVDLITSEEVAGVDQHETGTLFSCDEARHQWHGYTFVALTSGSDVESIVGRLEEAMPVLFSGRGDFDVTHYRDIADGLVVMVESSTTAEGYLIGEGDPGTIIIDSWSECFTLPEGTYPGGSF
jgi:hypothetical protein